MKKPIRTYIASPYSPVKRLHKLPIIKGLFHKAKAKEVTRITAKLLEQHNIAPICPITQSHELAKFLKNKDGGFKKWQTIDFSYIDGCDQVFVVMMKGWKDSIGVQAEIKYARKKKLPIIYFDINAKQIAREV